MTSRHALKSNTGIKQSRRYRDLARRKARKLHLEYLEDRRVMAAGPTLIALLPNSGVPLSFTNNDVLHVAPNELLFRFSEGQTIDPNSVQQGIRITRAGLDGVFGDPNNTDVTITPGFVGIGERPREVILRFAENLPNDAYQVTLVGTGLFPLRDTNGNPVNGGVDQVIPFQLDLGAQIIAVVPQPVGRNAQGQLTQDRSQVLVYFNADRLDTASAQNPAFYRLYERTPGSATIGRVQIPTSVAYSYDVVTNRAQAVLQFAGDVASGFYELQVGTANDANNTIAASLHIGTGTTINDIIGDGPGSVNDVDLFRFDAISAANATITLTPSAPLDGVIRVFDANGAPIGAPVDVAGVGGAETLIVAVPAGAFYVGISSKGNAGYNAVDGSGAAGGSSTGSYRLGVSYAKSPTGSDDNSSFVTASNAGALGSSLFTISSSIDPRPYNLVWPGAMDDPGHRDMPPDPTGESHLNGGPDGFSSTFAISYNFQDIYGFDPITGQPLHNVITENQKQRAREVFDLYSRYMGVTFVETLASGLIIATGDPRAVDPTVPPGAVGGIAGGGVAVMNSALNWGDSEYAGGWFETAMHEIGHLLGLGHSYDLPPITVQGSAENAGTAGTGAAEPVFPGDHDIVHGQTLFRPDSKDIDLYKFTVTETGTFTAETTAERNNSNLNTVLWLYKEVVLETGEITRELISRNDDYYSEDSFLELTLEPGTYYIGVTASGMTEVDPTITDSGFGGRSAGAYQLGMKLTPPSQQTIVDTTGTKLDGDADGTPGGTHSFWFHSNTAANTIFVDRANDTGPGVQGNGSLLNPYDTISAALTAADTLGTPANPVVVRIVGNGGTDGLLSTAADARPYLLGFNDGNVALRDGASFRVPNDVTVMVDAGAVIKLQQANLDAGSTSTNVDRGRGAIQVLGTPAIPVYMTAYSNDALGGDSDGVTDGAHRGDWGGVVYRSDSDREADGIFLNYVNHADMTYGGGRVVVDSVEDIYNPVHMLEARPTVSFNTITLSADAAISANPDSFDDSLGRIGPDVHGNDLRNNSVNGLLVRTRATSGNNALSVQTVFGRWDDTDIVHVVSDNLILRGQPGGRFGGIAGNKFDARLRIDPGIVVKLDGSRIEAEFSSQIIAEGTQSLPVVFTSLRDDRFGAANPFDTNNDAAASTPIPGDWGGIRFNPTAIGSVDWAKMYYGGGTVPIEGGFAAFNLVEVYQADVRISNTFLESSANGRNSQTSDPNRAGRGTNADAVIFVRGAQPVIVNNVFRNNAGNVISINANAMQSTVQADYGRSTGQLGLTGGLFGRTDRFDDNQGPLVRLNRTGNNTTNGMEVRGGVLTTETVWDDTDIVHVVRNEVLDVNHHVYGGLMIKSSPSESLVVKLDGSSAGVTADGVLLEIDDRIGGTVQIVGQPGFPVVMTSLHDCTAGAGFNTDGQLQTDTDNSGGCGGVTITAPPYADIIVLMDESGSMGFAQVFSVQFVADLEAGLLARGIGSTSAGGNRYGLFGYGGASPITDGHVIPVGAGGTPFGTSVEYAAAAATLVSNGGFEDGYLAADLMLQNYTPRLDAAKFVILVTNEDRDIGDPTKTFGSTLAGLQNAGYKLQGILDVDIRDAASNVALALDAQDNAYVDNGAGGYVVTPNGSFVGAFGTTIPDYADMVFATGGIVGDINQISSSVPTAQLFSQVLVASIVDQAVNSDAGAGDWRSIRLDHLSNDRNVGVVNEREFAYGEKEATLSNGVSDINSTPQKAQFLGSLATDDKNGDDNRRLGWQIHGAIQFDDTTDVDVYSFNANAGTEVWIDIDRTSFALDTIVELIDANGNVLARSENNSILSGLALTMDKDSYLGRDTFTTNPLDAGMRVILPVPPTGNNTPYFVRVRSTPVGGSVNDITAGGTKGQYQLQIRLRQEDEQPGSVVRLSDIRFATNGIEVLGLPYHSPLLGESAEGSNPNDSFATAQPLGNLLTSDRNVIGVAGNLSGQGDIDWYRFDLNYDLIQAIGGFSDGFKTFATMFDIDYGDGITRPDTTISVFDQDGNLIFIGRDSDHDEDQPGAGQGADTDDLNRGSFGKLDPYIGSVQLPAGVLPSGINRTYYVAISTNRRLPTALNATFQANATSPQIRMEPIDSITRIAEDRIGSPASQSTAVPADLPLLFNADSVQSLQAHVKPFTLADVTLFVSQQNQLFTVDPFTGLLETVVAPNGLPADGNSLWDIAMRSDGRLFGYEGGLPGVQGSAGRLVELNAGNGALTAIGNDSIPDNAGTRGFQDNSAFIVDALAWTGNSIGPVDGNNVGGYALWYTIPDNPLPGQNETGLSRLYRANPSSGSAAVATGFPWGRQGFGLIDGPVTGAATTDFGTNEASILNLRGNGDLIVTISRSAHGDASLPTVTQVQQFVNIDLNTTLLTASVQSDFNTGGAVDLRFVADAPGDVGNNIRISVTSRNLGFGVGPEVLANGNNIVVTLNSNLGSPTTATQLVNAVNASPAGALVDASIIAGSGATTLGDRIINYSPLQLAGGNDPSTTQDVVDAVNASGILQAFATGDPDTVVATQDPTTYATLLRVVGGAIGRTTGLTSLNDQLYGVSDAGQIYQVDPFAFGGMAQNATQIELIPGENFQTGVFQPGWTGNWSLTNQGGFLPDWVAQTTPGSSAISTLEFSATLPVDGAISFEREIVDFFIPGANSPNPAQPHTLQFTIDGVPQQAWSGDTDRGGASFQVSAGTHTFRWTFIPVTTPANPPTIPGPVPPDPVDRAIIDNIAFGPSFSGLTFGPQNMQDGFYADMFFATTSDGALYGLSQQGIAQTIFDADQDGVLERRLETGINGATGLAFSPLDFNMWHTTFRRQNDPGHGNEVSPDQSRTSRENGERSFYFGLEEWVQIPDDPGSAYEILPDAPAGNAQMNIRQNIYHLDLTNERTNPGAIGNNYNLPGGAYGTLITDSFSLGVYKATDKPTIYFDYFLDTPDFQSIDNGRMRDAARVYISADGGLTWEMIATNNSRLDNPATFAIDGELPTFLSASVTELPTNPRQQIQELFDVAEWRQARVDLSRYAGQADLQIRFDFHTAGDTNEGLFEDVFGDFNNRERGQDNDHEGFFIDDIIIGMAERGEMVTSATPGVTGMFTTPEPLSHIPGVPVPAVVTAGPYNLEIRRGAEYGLNLDSLRPDIGLVHTFDTNERLMPDTRPVNNAFGWEGFERDNFTLKPWVFGGDAQWTTTREVRNRDVFSAQAGAIGDNQTSFMQFTQTTGIGYVTFARSVSSENGFDFLRFYVDGVLQDEWSGQLPFEYETYLVSAGNHTFRWEYSKDGSVATGQDTAWVDDINFMTLDGFETGDLQSEEWLTGDNRQEWTTADDRPWLVTDRTTNTGAFSAQSGDVSDGETSTLELARITGEGNVVFYRRTSTEAGSDFLRFYIDGILVDLPDGSGPAEWSGELPFEKIEVPVAAGRHSFRWTYEKDGSTTAGLDTVFIDDVSFPVPLRGVESALLSRSTQVNVGAIGDQNFIRQQGHIQIEQNYVTNSAQVGILVDNAPRDAGGSLPYPGAARNLPTLNNPRLFAAVTVANNVVTDFGQVGIRFSGDPNPAGQTVAATPFGRLVNNTVYGGAGPAGVGIQVTDNAGPTIMNNILANTATAISIDGGSAPNTVVGANLFSNNASNGTNGTNFIQLNPGDPLFVNPARRNFYLADNSRAIDSSLNSLADRPSIVAVKSPLGITPSPILAPDRDALGQLRVDDPTQDPPPGLGSNIFKDRGAVERADFVGPVALLKVPADNDPLGLDQDVRETFVIFDSQLLDRFVIKFLDTGGIGIDDLLVSGARFVLTQDGVPLQQGVDYAFVFDNNADEVLFLPAAGVWAYRKTYVLTIDNSAATGIADLAGNLLQANQADGSTRYNIFVGAPIDFGDAPDDPANPADYPTLEASNGAGHKFKPAIYLGTGVTPDIVPLPTPNADGDTLDDGLVGSQFNLNTPSQMTVVASVDGKLDAWLDLNRDGDWSDAGEYIVSSSTPAGQLLAGSNTVNFTLPDGSKGTTFLRLRFSTAGIATPTGLAEDGEVEDYQVQLLGPPFQNPGNVLDVNNDNKVSPNDALLIINALNRAILVLGTPGFSLPHPQLAPAAPPYLDVNGDNRVSTTDAALVIGYLNSIAGPQGEGEADSGSLPGASSSSTASKSSSSMPAVLFASSSILVEAKSSAGRSTLDDQLFAGEPISGDFASAPAAVAQPDFDDDLESSSRKRSWDQAIEEFDMETDLLGDVLP